MLHNVLRLEFKPCKILLIISSSVFYHDMYILICFYICSNVLI